MPTVLAALRSPTPVERVDQRLLPGEGGATPEGTSSTQQLAGDPSPAPATPDSGVDDGRAIDTLDLQLRSDAQDIGVPGPGRSSGAGGVPAASQPVHSTGSSVAGIVTHYGESYNGGTLGCGNYGNALAKSRLYGGVGDGIYRSSDPTIAAALQLPDGTRAYACGAVLDIVGSAGGIRVVVGDTCPGCAWNHIDLSEAGIEAVCGGRYTCAVTITKVVGQP